IGTVVRHKAAVRQMFRMPGVPIGRGRFESGVACGNPFQVNVADGGPVLGSERENPDGHINIMHLMPTSRRMFLQSAAWTGVALAQTPPGAIAPDKRVYLTGDGVMTTPAEYARLLTRIVDEQGAAADTYLQGGAVEQLEKEFARLLGKERALFL